MQGLVVHAAKAERLAGFEQVLHARREQQGLHELAAGFEVEQRAGAGEVAHLEYAGFLVVTGVAQRTAGHIHLGVFAG